MYVSLKVKPAGFGALSPAKAFAWSGLWSGSSRPWPGGSKGVVVVELGVWWARRPNQKMGGKPALPPTHSHSSLMNRTDEGEVSPPFSIAARRIGTSGGGGPCHLVTLMHVIALHLLFWRKMLVAFSLEKTIPLNILGGKSCLGKIALLCFLELSFQKGLENYHLYERATMIYIDRVHYSDSVFQSSR